MDDVCTVSQAHMETDKKAQIHAMQRVYHHDAFAVVDCLVVKGNAVLKHTRLWDVREYGRVRSSSGPLGALSDHLMPPQIARDKRAHGPIQASQRNGRVFRLMQNWLRPVSVHKCGR